MEKYNEWIELCKSTAKDFGTPEDKETYLLTKLFAECGEFLGDYCGWKFHQNEKKKAKLVDEAGDVLWYIWNLADMHGIIDCIYLHPENLSETLRWKLLDIVIAVDTLLHSDSPTKRCTELSFIFSIIVYTCMEEGITLDQIAEFNSKKILERSGGTGVYNEKTFNTINRS